MFKPVDPKINFPKLEENILKFWKENKTFEKSIENRSNVKKWTFLDGPPFVTGLPHYGSLLSSIPKDVFGRYWTMKGYKVRRVWGWDGHGLPIENKVENELQIKRKKDIEEKIGVKTFIDRCLHYVNQVSDEWEWYVDHIGRWVDFKNAYKTWDLPYMETVMWVFKQMFEKGYVYKGLRVSLYCPHCVTPISNFEVAMDQDNYKDLTEPTAVFKYKLADEKDTYFLAWSTTPWNKIATPALAVNPKLSYVKVQQGNEKYILAESTVKILKDDPYKILEGFKGSKLIGKKFTPHYKFYEIEKGKKTFIVIGGDFVTADEGTGIVTIAAYGEEDLTVMLKENIQIILHVDEEGKLKPNVPKWAGMFYLDVDPLVIEDLKSRGLIYRVDSYTHSIPTCWRCHTRLLYVPQDAWYVNVQNLKEKMKRTNRLVNWFPKHFKYGRYLKSLESAPDWCISRSRFWGSPVPVWECECGERFVPGSIAQLEEASGIKINDLHKPLIDEVTVMCKACGKRTKRVPEVLDSWIEAGSASFAERHFPFDKEEKLEDFFPPDFIAEYTGQIRAWFYVLHVISTALYDSIAFKNVVVTGVISGTDGRKMSKNFNNYPDPKEMLNKYGGDALRLYLMGSPVMHGEDVRISEEEYKNQVRGLMLILWNVYNFFVTYANIDQWDFKNTAKNFHGTHVLDKWIENLLNRLITDVTDYLESYDTVGAVKALETFINELSTWYVRRSRDRIGPTAKNKEDKNNCYATLYKVLTNLTRLLAPFTPFLAEEIFKNLTNEESVHLTQWPKTFLSKEDKKLLSDMKSIRKICELAHAKRKEVGIRVRQPLSKLVYKTAESFSGDLEQLISDEVNVKVITWEKSKVVEPSIELVTKVTKDLMAEGETRDLIRKIQKLRKEEGLGLTEKISLVLPDWPKKFENLIKKETLTVSITSGAEVKIVRQR